MEEYLTVKEVADALRLHFRTVYKWIARGDLVATKLPNGQLRVAESELRRVLKVCSE